MWAAIKVSGKDRILRGKSMDGIIHIGGTMPRIGTTTVGLQLILFLQVMGYEAAYVEMNRQDYIWGCENLYMDCKQDKLPGKVTIHGVDMFAKEWMAELISGGTHYDYILCDYGNIHSADFDRKEFGDCGAMVIVAGVKPNEIFATERALHNPVFKEAAYVFSFVSEGDRGEIRNMMRGKAKETTFMPYSPDPFERNHFKMGDNAGCFMEIMNYVVRMGGDMDGQI